MIKGELDGHQMFEFNNVDIKIMKEVWIWKFAKYEEKVIMSHLSASH